MEDKKVEETAQPPDASKRLRKRQKSAPDLADQGLAVEKPAQEAAPKKKFRKKKSTAGHGHGPDFPEGGDVEPAQAGAAEVEMAAGSFALEDPAAEACPTKKRRKKGLRKKPAQSVDWEELEPEVEQAAGSAEVLAEVHPKKKRKAKTGLHKEETEKEPQGPAEDVEKTERKKTKAKAVGSTATKDVEKTMRKTTKAKAVGSTAKDAEQTTRKMTKAKASGSTGAAPGTVDEDLKKEMVALLKKWHGKEYNRNEETYHSSDEFGEAIAFTVYWTRPAVGIKIWDYEEEDWSQKAYFAKYSLTLCIFMARKFALQLFKKGLEWGSTDEGIAFRNDLKATAVAAEDAFTGM